MFLLKWLSIEVLPCRPSWTLLYCTVLSRSEYLNFVSEHRFLFFCANTFCSVKVYRYCSTKAQCNVLQLLLLSCHSCDCCQDTFWLLSKHSKTLLIVVKTLLIVVKTLMLAVKTLMIVVKTLMIAVQTLMISVETLTICTVQKLQRGILIWACLICMRYIL